MDLESFNAKLKPICRLQTVFSTETRVLMRIYLHTTKFNLVKGMYAKLVQWFECSAPKPEPGIQLQVGTLNFFCFLLLFCSCFCFVLCELDILKVINCFFFSYKVAHFLKNIQPCL